MRKLLKTMIAVATTLSLVAIPVHADAERVVTIGADLSDSEESAILRYFGVDTNKVRVIYVTNDEEVDFLSDYIPMSVIGTRTLSCAYVKPTNSGGIQVKTANLTWVTPNMIASALSTSGVKNCEVIAACPMEVSGTGALTGVLKAYEHASNTKLDESKKSIAAQEIATTSNIAETVGQDEATQIINEIKIQLFEDDVDSDNTDKIENIVDDAVDRVYDATDEIVDLSEEELEELRDLARRIAEQEYEFDDMKETLSRIENNVSKDPITITIENNNTNNNTIENSSNQSTDNTVDNTLDSDSILKNTDDTALGDDVLIEATTEDALDTIEFEDDMDYLTNEVTEEAEDTQYASDEAFDFGNVTEYSSEADETTEEMDEETNSVIEEIQPIEIQSDEIDNTESMVEENTESDTEDHTDEKTDDGTEDKKDTDSNNEEKDDKDTSEYEGNLKDLEIYLDDEAVISPFALTFKCNRPFEEGKLTVFNEDEETEIELSVENLMFYRNGKQYIGFIKNYERFAGDSIQIEADGFTFETDAKTILPDVTIEQDEEEPYAYNVITDYLVTSDDENITCIEQENGFKVVFEKPTYGKITVDEETFDICAE